MHVVVVLLFSVAGLGDQRVFVVGRKCVLCGFLDVVGGGGEVFERGDGVRAEVKGSVAGDGSGGKPEKPIEWGVLEISSIDDEWQHGGGGVRTT